MKELLTFTVNGEEVGVAVEPHWMLLDVLRDHLGLTGVKEGCGLGECGACTVILDGRTVNSCITPVLEAQGAEVTTIEGLLREDGRLSPLQQAFVDHGGVQCGFCTRAWFCRPKRCSMKTRNPPKTKFGRGWPEISAGVQGIPRSLRPLWPYPEMIRRNHDGTILCRSPDRQNGRR